LGRIAVFWAGNDYFTEKVRFCLSFCRLLGITAVFWAGLPLFGRKLPFFGQDYRFLGRLFYIDWRFSI